MKIFQIILAAIILLVMQSCRGSRITPTTMPQVPTDIITDSVPSDSLHFVKDVLKEIKKNRIDFQTFSGKAKIQFEDENGRQPDGIANIRMLKDSIIWVSVSSAFLGIEAIRMLITPQEIIVLKKLEKIVERKPFSEIQKELQIPVSFSDLQDIVLGNPVMIKDSIVGYSEQDNFIIVNTFADAIYNLLTINQTSKNVISSKISDEHFIPANTALFEFGDYQNFNGVNFANYRRIKVDSKMKRAEARMAFQQFEFNKELSFPFSIPQNYKAN